MLNFFLLLDVFSLVAYPSTDHDVVDRQHLSILFQQAIVVCILFFLIDQFEILIHLDPETTR